MAILQRCGRWVSPTVALRVAALASVCLTFVVSASSDAQMPGIPVLQNAWANRGITGAANLGGGADASSWGAAAAWGSGRFQLSGGAGMHSRTGTGWRGAYGVRGAMGLASFAGDAFGVSAFAGVGGSGGNDTTEAITQI